MKKPENMLSQETISDFTAEMMKDEKEGEEFTREYLKAKFLSSVGRSLYYARRKAGLTQEEVAERMNTKQSAIARLEADQNGSMTFRRYVEFALACDMMPRSLMIESILEPINTLRNEMIALAESQHTKQVISVLSHANLKPELAFLPTMVQTSTIQSETPSFSLATQGIFSQENTPTADSAVRWLKEHQYLGQSTA